MKISVGRWWVPPWGQGLSHAGVQAPLDSLTWTRPSPAWASVSPGVKGENPCPDLTFPVGSGPDLLGEGLTGKPPGRDVMGPVPSVSVTVTLYREGQAGQGSGHPVLPLSSGSAQRREQGGSALGQLLALLLLLWGWAVPSLL